MARTFTRFLLALLLAGCGNRGCVSEDRVHVLYRGQRLLEEGAPVTVGDVAVGYIERVAQSKNLQRATVRVRSAKELRSGSRFEPSASKPIGFDVRLGAGEPLFDGAEVDADPKFSLRQTYAGMASEAPHGVTLPSGVHVPFPAGLTAESRSAEKRAKKDQRMVERALRMREFEKPRYADVPAPLMDRYLALQARLQEMDDVQALAMLKSDGAALLQSLEETRREAVAQGDHKAAQAAKQLAERIKQGQRRLEREVGRDERMGPRKVRERYVPPDFR